MLFLDILECTQFFFHDLIWPIEDTPDNSAAQDDSNNQNAGNDACAGNNNTDDDMINGEDENPEDIDYYLEYVEDRSLGPNEFDVIEEPL